MPCHVWKNRHGFLAYRLRNWKVGGRPRETVIGTKLRDTKANRAAMQLRADVMSAEMKAHTFDYVRWFPHGNLVGELAPRSRTQRVLTLAQWYAIWIADKKPPLVRQTRARDYRQHWRGYLEGALGSYPLDEIGIEVLGAFRQELLTRVGLKTARNVIGGTLQAMLRDARIAERTTTPHVVLPWPRQIKRKPDPFTAEERDAILAWFGRAQRNRRDQYWRYAPLMVVLFHMGLRPGEAVGLRWSDVDLKRRKMAIVKSRTMREDNAPKTEGSDRTIDMPELAVRALQAIRPLHHEDESVFTTWTGRDISQETGNYSRLWARALRATGTRYRKPYTARHTFISLALSMPGANVKEIAEYCGTSVAMIERHYGAFLRPQGAASLVEQLNQATTPNRSKQGNLLGNPRKHEP